MQPEKQINVTEREKAILTAIKDESLTSSEIFNKTKKFFSKNKDMMNAANSCLQKGFAERFYIGIAGHYKILPAGAAVMGFETIEIETETTPQLIAEVSPETAEAIDSLIEQIQGKTFDPDSPLTPDAKASIQHPSYFGVMQVLPDGYKFTLEKPYYLPEHDISPCFYALEFAEKMAVAADKPEHMEAINTLRELLNQAVEAPVLAC